MRIGSDASIVEGAMRPGETDSGLEFLEAFKAYLNWHLSGRKGPMPLSHEKKFEKLLESLGGRPGTPDFASLKASMEAMKESEGRSNPKPTGSRS
jgi:hypothetical protein